MKKPDTISDTTWRALQDRARKANPHLDSLTHPEAIKRRKQASEQHAKRKWS
ncbi:hypothetical protein PS9374_03485 [Planomonospora sphaerica]|uniref:Uncharacterized protein n=1 Tax=Planomonospora sphaerica TaxID=161355 RepID=A0A161LLF4_9ACTN|nr:hypothetical protein [Planomonospora sphaerica]GAT67825.1 hypothetical protein PS9374_03485 [Planomonospora sphaerica]